jgi:peptidoglycan/xylan/chitin deacetylase (PgdA/CDA1 family)
MMKKTVCFTIDVEPDFGGLLEEDVYYGKDDLFKLEKIVKENKIKLTAFVTGKTLEDNPEILSRLVSMHAEIECHSYSHRVGHGSKLEDIEHGIKTYEKLVGRTPMGYRAPQGIISKKEVLFLDSKGIKFDSSIFPTYFPGRYNHLQFPLQPFKMEGANLLEIPFSVIPWIRIPFGLSYMQLLGFRTFQLLFKVFGQPNLIVFDFHTYELGKLPSYSQLPLGAKVGYFRAQKAGRNPADVFEKFVRYLLGKGYQSKYMLEVYETLCYSAPHWRWVES